MEGLEVLVNGVSARVCLKYCLGDEHFLAPAAGLTGSGNAETSYASITSAATRSDFKQWTRSFFCWHWRPAEIVAHVQKSGLSALDIDKLDRGELCDLLKAMECPTDYTAARHHTKADGGCNVDELRRAAKHVMRGACAVCSARMV